MKVANYFVGLSVKPDKASIKSVDNLLKQMDKRLDLFSKTSNKKLAEAFKGFTLPAIKVKKFTFDSLSLQRNAQMELNKVGRLLELPIMNFTVNQAKLNRQMQTSLQRAANQSKISTKFITGNSGGYGVHHVGGANSIGGVGGITPRQSRQFSSYGAPAMGGAMGAVMGGLGGYLAPSAVGYAAWSGYNALYSGNADAVSSRHAITNIVSDPNASYKENTAKGKKAFDYLYSESNRLGLDAKVQAEGYGKVLASGQSSGLSIKDSQKLFTNLSEHATVMHLDQQKQARLNMALGQMLAKGQVMSSELKEQMGESSPTLPAYFAKAWALQTKSNLKGADAMAALMKAMERGEVKSAIALKALELASKDAQPSLARSTQTSAAEANRARNIRSYSINEASVAGVEDGFYRVNKAIAIFAADLAPHGEAAAVSFAKYLGTMADFTLGLRGLAKNIPGSKQQVLDTATKLPHSYITRAFAGGPASLAVDLGKLSYNVTTDYMRGSTHVTQGGINRMKGLQESFSMPQGVMPITGQKQGMLDAMASQYQKAVTNNSTINSTINITSTATNAGDMFRDIKPQIDDLWRSNTMGMFSGAILNYPQTE